MVRRYIMILLQVIGFFCYAQKKPLLFNTLTQSDGLSESTNAYVYKDTRGFVWISSVNGLNRYDGQKIKVYANSEGKPGGLLGGNIQSTFFEDSLGDIWFTTDQAINCYRWKKDYFDQYFVKNKNHIPSRIPYHAIKLDQFSYLWVVANDTLFKLDTKNPGTDNSFTMVTELPNAVRYDLLNAPTGEIESVFSCYWDVQPGFEMINLPKSGAPIQRQKFFDQHSDHPLVCRQVVCINKNEVYFATNQGLLVFNPRQSAAYKIYPVQIDDKGVQRISRLNQHTLLIVSSKGLVYEFNLAEQRFGVAFVHKNINNTAASPQEILANSVYMASDGVLWYTKYTEGVYYANYRSNIFAGYPLAEQFGQKNYISTQVVETAADTVYCFNQSNKFMQIVPGQEHPCSTTGSYPSFLKDRSGDVMLFSIAGVPQNAQREADLKRLQSTAIKGLQPLKYHIVRWKNDTLLIGCMNGLFCLALTTNTLSKISVIDCCVTDLLLDSHNRLWVGSTDKLLLYSLDAVNSIALQSSFEKTGFINTIIAEGTAEEVVWAGSSKGLFKYVQPDMVQIVGSGHDVIVYSIVFDHRNRAWISTDNGIFELDASQAGMPMSKHFTARNGLTTGQYCPDASLYSSAGYIWFGHTKGIDVFHPDSIRDLGHAPQLALVGLKIHDQVWRSDSSIEVVQRIELPYNQNTLRLELAAMEYLDPKHNQFKVLLQLEGEKAQWTDLGTQNFVTYANLKPGKYTFKFIACNAEDIWVDEKDARTLSVVIFPHWSDTWWFRSLLAAMVLIFVAAATAFYYRYQLRAQQLQTEKIQREAERQRLELQTTAALADGQRKVAESEMKLLRSQLNPHFLFNAMNSINRYILSNERDKASEYLGQFAQLTRNILENSRSMTIPLADELAMLHNYLALENHRFGQQIHWTFTIAPDVDEDELRVPSMILQPFAENAILHGLAPKGGGHIAVEISIHEHALQCIIRDDGVGRGSKEPSVGKHSSVGMRLIEERLDAFGALNAQMATFIIVDLKDVGGNASGTEVVIRLPLVA